MKIKDGFIKAEAFDGYVVTSVGEESKNNKVMVTLNSTASEIWDLLADGNGIDEIVAAIAKKYNISEDKAKSGVDNVIDTLKKEGILEE